MKKLSKNDLEILKQYEPTFKMAQQGYIHGVYSYDVSKVTPIYIKLGYKPGCPSCGSSVLGMFKELGIIYESNKNKKTNNKNVRTGNKPGTIKPVSNDTGE